MPFTLYKPTDLERWINEHYLQHGIFRASDMCMELIAESFGIEVHYYSGPSFADWMDEEDGYKLIVLNRELPEWELRAEFFHELAHPLQHVGRQDGMPELFVELQEIQAANFQLSAAIPIYMLEEFTTVSPGNLVRVLAEEFRLPESFVIRRLEQIKARIRGEEWRLRLPRRRCRAWSRIHPDVAVEKDHVRQALFELRRLQLKRKGGLS